MLKDFKGGGKLIRAIVSLALIASIISCATQNRHGKVKPVPCPCETRGKR
jgi:hypothetical protein